MERRRLDDTQTHDEKTLMDIYTCAPLIHHFHVEYSFLTSAPPPAGVCRFSVFSGLFHLLEQGRQQGVVRGIHLRTVSRNTLGDVYCWSSSRKAGCSFDSTLFHTEWCASIA